MPSQTFLPRGVHDGLITEEWDHTAIHSGQVWRVGSYQTIGASSTLSVMMTTGTEENVHVSFAVNTNGPGVAQFFESTVASGGTALTAKNALRSSTNTSSATLVTDPAISTTGSAIGVNVVGSEGFKSEIGGSIESRVWILKASTNYLVRFTADAASCRTVIRMIWLED